MLRYMPLRLSRNLTCGTLIMLFFIAIVGCEEKKESKISSDEFLVALGAKDGIIRITKENFKKEIGNIQKNVYYTTKIKEEDGKNRAFLVASENQVNNSDAICILDERRSGGDFSCHCIEFQMGLIWEVTWTTDHGPVVFPSYNCPVPRER